MTAEEFEWFVGEIFRRDGYGVAETGNQAHADGNVDLVLRKDGKRTIVPCKRWQSWNVGVDEIRKFAGTLMREGLPGESGVFVTLWKFTARRRPKKRHRWESH